MKDKKIILEALNTAVDFLKLIRDLHDERVLLPATPESVYKQFFGFLDGAAGRCERAIAILECDSLTGGKEPGSRTLH